MPSALLIEFDEAVGHWLVAVLSEAGFDVVWERDVEAAAVALGRAGSRTDLCVVEGVIGGQGVELCAEAKRLGASTVLLIPRGGAAMQGVADRILEHPLTRTGLLEALGGLSAAAAPEAPSPRVAAPPPAPVVGAPLTDDELRMYAAAEDRLRLGLAALQEGNFDAAVIELDVAAVLAKHDPRPKLYAAWARYSRVRASVAKAAELRAELAKHAAAVHLADGRYFLAAAAHDFGDADVASREASSALEVDPHHAAARQLLEIVGTKPRAPRA